MVFFWLTNWWKIDVGSMVSYFCLSVASFIAFLFVSVCGTHEILK